MNRILRTSLEIAAAALVAVHGTQHLTAGTVGAYMNSAGYGKAADSVGYGGVVSQATSISMYYPCAAVAPLSTFTCNALYTQKLPLGTPTTVYCQSKGAPNYVWSIQSSVTGGATADNAELEARINIPAADCASYMIETETDFLDDKSGYILINASATTGAAVWLRGYEFNKDFDPDNPTTTGPVDLDDLKQNGRLVWDLLFPGPFTYTSSNCRGLIIPFITLTGHKNLYFVVDGIAKSKQFEITCPESVTFRCGDPMVYPLPQITGGCGTYTVTYDPPANSLPAGTVTTVTATVTDEAGNETQCTFLADTTAKKLTVTCPPNVIFRCGDPVVYPAPQITSGCGPFVVSYSPAIEQLPLTPTTVTVTVTDAIGGSAQCTFVADASAKALSITCGNNVVFGCADPIVYPAPQITGGCAPFVVTYDPPANLLPAAVTTVTTTVTDVNGKTAQCTFTADASAKAIPLTVTCPGNVSFACDQTPAYLPATVSGNCGNYSLVYSPPANQLPVGVTTVTVTATDAAGRTAQCTFTADTSAKGIPLTVTCPGNVSFACNQTPAYPPATVLGFCKSYSVVYNPPANQLPVGVTTVTVTATDGAGRTAQCTFTADTTSKAFSITCPGDVVLGCVGPLVYPAPTVQGGCGTVSVTYSPAVTALPIGTTTQVTATATDSLGRTVQCQFNATRESGLTFTGFYPPINGSGGTCSAPIRRINLGSSIPVKFNTYCAGVSVNTGEPKILIKSCATGAVIVNGTFKIVANEWHFNWDTSGLTAGVYELDVTLQDASLKTAFVRLK